MPSETAVLQLVEARKRYDRETSAAYDEVLREVSERIHESGSVGKMDVGALLFWKRLRADTRWASGLNSLLESEIRQVTADVVSAVNDHDLSIPAAAQSGRAGLSGLPGFSAGDALASAILMAAAPYRMAVYDRRADQGLQMLLGVHLGSAPRRYARYMAQVEALMVAVNDRDPDALWIPRDVDLALFVLGKR